MAKLKNPLLSLGAVGRLAKDLVFTRRRGVDIAEKKPEILDVKSLAQLSWRHMYQKAVALWHALSPAEQQDWESQARSRHMTGFAWFMSQALKPNPGLYLPLQGGTMSGQIAMGTNSIIGLPLPTGSGHAARKSYVDAKVALATYTQGCLLTRSAGLAIPTATDVYVSFDVEEYDTDAMHNGVNPDRLYCKTAGKYIVTALVRWPQNGAGVRLLRLYIYPANTIYAEITTGPTGTTFDVQVFSTLIDLAINQYFRMQVRQTSGGDLNLVGGTRYLFFGMQRVG